MFCHPEKILEVLLEGSPDAVFVKDRRCRYVGINPAGARMIGRSVPEVIGRTDFDLFPPASAKEKFERDQEVILRGSQLICEVEDEIDGRTVVFELSKGPYRDFEGRVIGVIGIARDITSRKRQQQLEREMKDRLVTGLSHDMRTPLATIRMAAQVIEQAHADPRIAANLATRIVHASSRADRMIRDLLDAYQMRAGEELKLKMSQVDVCGVLRDCLRDLSAIHGDRFVLQLDQPSIVGRWSADGIQRVIENLCTNAIRYGDAGAKVTLRAEALAGSIRLSVHNRGKAIPPAERDQLFKQFRRASAAEGHDEFVGWGVGLSVVQGIVQAHDGCVWVESGEDAGTTFYIDLPWRAAASSA